MLIQILCPVSKRPEGVNILTSGGLKAVSGGERSGQHRSDENGIGTLWQYAPSR
jgi:hypothetical protein